MKGKFLAAVVVFGVVGLFSVTGFAAVNGFSSQGQKRLAAASQVTGVTSQQESNKSNLVYLKAKTKKWHERVMMILRNMDC